MNQKLFYTIIIIIIIVLLGAGWYFFFVLNGPATIGNLNGSTGSSSGFSPFGSYNGETTGTSTTGNGANSQNGTGPSAGMYSWPKVRELYATPIGGFVASSTSATSTFVRLVDRGTGYVYDMNMASATPRLISNTTVPMIYESYWAGNAMSAIFRYIKDGTDDVTNFYVQVKPSAAAVVATASSSATTTAPILSETPDELRGAYFPGNVLSMAVSPSGTQIFTIENVNGNGVGYISNFDGSKSNQIFSTPLTQVDAFWPTAGTLMMATKASGSAVGYLYSVNIKTGAMNEVLGGLYGLSVLPNPAGNLIMYSDIGTNGSLVSALYNTQTGSSQDLPFATLADKCVWSKLVPTDLYCAVPTGSMAGFPDAWYMGTASTIDNIEEVDTDTGTVHLVSNLQADASASIDAEWLSLGPNGRYLYFVNKKDLSLWSVDLDQVGQ